MAAARVHRAEPGALPVDSRARPALTGGKLGSLRTYDGGKDVPSVTIDVVGCVWLRPALNPVEFEYLAAFCESRRWRRPAGPYAVPDHPLVELAAPDLDLAAYAEPASGQPGLWCPWRPGREGRALVPAVDPARPPGGQGVVATWLAYLEDHFLGARANVRGRPEFDGFGFDHRLDGAAAVYEPEHGEVTLLRVRESRIEVEHARDAA